MCVCMCVYLLLYILQILTFSEIRFADVLRKRIFLLLREKEKHAIGEERAQRWLSNEAASVPSVNNAGTFRY